MANVVIKYQRLPGRGLALGESSRLYLADDHLLMVTATGFTESYRRFQLRDIQCIMARKSLAWPVMNGVLGFFLFFMFIGLLSSENAGEVVGWSVASGIFLGMLVMNLIRGPTCQCEIHTAVQSRRLSAVTRLGAARKLIARLRPVIEAAQGAMPVDEMRLRIDQARQQPLSRGQ